jgi:hypothetical protein
MAPSRSLNAGHRQASTECKIEKNCLALQVRQDRYLTPAGLCAFPDQIYARNAYWRLCASRESSNHTPAEVLLRLASKHACYRT